MGTPDDPVGRSGQLTHLTPLHLAIHLVEAGPERLVLSRSLDIFGDPDHFERAGGVVVDLGSYGQDGLHSVSRLFAGVGDNAGDPVALKGAGHSEDLSLGATTENSASASSLGLAADRPVEGEVSTSLTADFGEALVDQRDRHGSLTYGSRATLDRPTPDVAGGEQPGQVGFER